MPDDPPSTVSEAVPAKLYVVAPPRVAPKPFPAREKMKKRGVTILTDTELLAVILSDHVGDAAERLVRANGGIQGLDGLTVKDLMDLSGVGLAHALRVAAVFELQRRIRVRSNLSYVRLQSPRDVFNKVADIVCHKKEYLLGLYLDAQNGLIHRETLSVGSLNTTRTPPREIFFPAITHAALGFILVHNHPSGCPEPSQEDIEFTKATQRAGELIGIGLYDHLIVAERGYVSLRERGVM